MRKRKIELKKQVVIVLTSIILLGSGCEDCINTRGNTSIGEGTPVEVTFRIGLADETDSHTQPGVPATKMPDRTQAFSYALCPVNETKATTSLKPAALYNLEIRQYRGSDGAYLGGSGIVTEEVATGSLITATLQTATKCHLVLVAWGKGNTTNRLGTVTLSKAQGVTVSNSYMNAIDPAKQDDMNKMPYVLHLTDVNVSSDGNLYSSVGEAIDIRLLLKRLATRLTVSWNYSASVSGANYQLGQILFQSVPLNYNVVAAPDSKSNNTYPSLLDQFTTLQLTGVNQVDSYSCWLPANVRGTNPAATSLNYRIKSNAPTGSTYIDFQAVNQNNTKQKLSYRVYLGSNDSYDFNLYGNRNYTYTVNFNHTTLPTNDLRVSIIDPVPASLGNSNFVPTANCFMVAPGGSFCFNPYKYAVNDVNGPNTLLQKWCSTDKIQSVKVLWQTKENGDVGDPVLGVVSSATEHTNIVELTDGDNFDNARIYCRVAPNTSGGNGVIAAYASKDGTGAPLWSWHIWVTNYAPDAKSDISVDDPNKRVQKYTYNGQEQKPMMDRNLGAQAGYIDVPDGDLDKSKANGFHYQCGRKDPFPSTYSSALGSSSMTLYTDKPTPGMLNYYQSDGFTYFVRTAETQNISIRGSFQNPTTTYTANDKWCSESDYNLWNDGTNGTVKTYHDPCPAGWRVAGMVNYRSLFSNPSYSGGTSNNAKETMNLKNASSASTDGGVVLYFENKASGRSTYIRMTGYQDLSTSFIWIGQAGNLWCRESNGSKFGYALSVGVGGGRAGMCNITGTWRPRDSHPVRCIQDR